MLLLSFVKMAFRVIVLSCLLALASAGPRPSLLATAPAAMRMSFGMPRIIDGDDANVGEFPHQVSLQVFNKGNLQHYCGGSIIASNWILTAGHCVVNIVDHFKIIVKAGKHNIYKQELSEQTLSVDKTFVHPKYKGDVGPYDIALLKLEGSLEFNERVSPIKLSEERDELEGNVVISGWGSTSKTVQLVQPAVLQRVTITLVDLETCRSIIKEISYGVEPPLHQTNICAGSLTAGVGACRGDSGGPLIVEGKNGGASEQVGVVSWGMVPCGVDGVPSIYVKVADFVDWIKSTVAANSH